MTVPANADILKTKPAACGMQNTAQCDGRNASSEDNVKAYGRKHGDELEDRHLGAPSKHRKSKHRKACRRILHQVARREAQKEIKKELEG